MRDFVLTRIGDLQKQIRLMDCQISAVDKKLEEIALTKRGLMSQKDRLAAERTHLENTVKAYDEAQRDEPAREPAPEPSSRQARPPVAKPEGKKRKKTAPEKQTPSGRVPQSEWKLLPQRMPADAASALGVADLAEYLKKFGIHPTKQAVYMQVTKLEKRGVVKRIKTDDKDLWYCNESNVVTLPKAAGK